jgi:predicted Zn finger-like uncharacterized protein
MRLICPNCDAQYEVDDAAIPPTGRDVQCSSCGHAWFQIPADAEPEPAVSPGPAGPDASAAMWSDPDGDRWVDPVETAPEALIEQDLPPDPSKPAEDAVPRRRGLDDSVLAVLREEAAREAAVRRAEAPPAMEMQTDLGLALPPPPPPPTLPPSVLAARERFADLSVSPRELPAEDDIAARPASRRELLPDIEEINSTLRASSEPRGDEGTADADSREDRERQGFRWGFVLILLVSVLLWSAYVLAPRIIAAVPASESAVQAYVVGVERARLGVDAALQSASRSLRSLSGLDGEGG